MADENLIDYLYVAVWDDVVHRPPFTVMHRIKLNDGVNREEFERFMAEDGFSQAAAASTRIGNIEAQYLLTESSSTPQRVEDLDLDLSSFGSQTSVSSFRLVHSWRRT